jgi:hypothetical protein
MLDIPVLPNYEIPLSSALVIDPPTPRMPPEMVSQQAAGGVPLRCAQSKETRRPDVFRLQRTMRDDATGQRIRMRRAKAEPYFLPCRPQSTPEKEQKPAHAEPVAEPQRPPGGGYGCTARCR